MKPSSFLIFSIVLSSIYLNKVQSQIIRTKNWYFGYNAGLSFNQTNAPEVLQDGVLASYEGSSTISDLNGNLLCYSNGEQVWDKTHQIMPNGNFLAGCTSSVQSSMILPHPNQKDSSNIYYLFTTDCVENSRKGGMSYSVIDVTLPGNGTIENPLGDIIANRKNILILPNSDEKMTAIQKSDGCGYWIIGHKNSTDSFYVFPFNIYPNLGNMGLGAPIKQKIGSYTSGLDYGALKTTIKGDILAMSSIGNIDLFKFNTGTGILSENIRFNSSIYRAYGIELSPSGQYLYAGSFGNIPQPELVQYDIGSYIRDTIINSKKIIASISLYGMQVASNGKIYIAKFSAPYTVTTIAEIATPDSPGTACNFLYNAIYLGPGAHFSSAGLCNFPNFMFSPEDTTTLNFEASGVCTGIDITFTADFEHPNAEYLWYFDDPVSQGNNTSEYKLATHQFANTGVYDVMLIVSTNCKSDTIIRSIQIFGGIIGNDTIQKCHDEAINLIGPKTDTNIFWNTEESGNSISAINEGLYTAYYYDTIGCKYRSEYAVESQQCGKVFIPNAFSPDNDGFNDAFSIILERYKNMKIHIQVFDRLGTKVFGEETTQLEGGYSWDGTYKNKLLDPGTYMYMVSLTIENRVQQISGNLTLIY